MAAKALETDAGPMNVLKAQHIVERLMPFLEQEAAIMLQEAHALLLQWTTALWGTPIALVEEEPQHAERERAEDDESCTATVPFSPLYATAPDEEAHADQAAGAGSRSNTSEAGSEESHRRRRMHGVCE